MAGKLPSDAFDFYVSLGADRSYKAVAEKYGVSKRAVTTLAAKEGWQQRARELEAQAREPRKWTPPTGSEIARALRLREELLSDEDWFGLV